MMSDKPHAIATSHNADKPHSADWMRYHRRHADLSRIAKEACAEFAAVNGWRPMVPGLPTPWRWQLALGTAVVDHHYEMLTPNPHHYACLTMPYDAEMNIEHRGAVPWLSIEKAPARYHPLYSSKCPVYLLRNFHHGKMTTWPESPYQFSWYKS
jgi:hypothetical protein